MRHVDYFGLLSPKPQNLDWKGVDFLALEMRVLAQDLNVTLITSNQGYNTPKEKPMPVYMRIEKCGDCPKVKEGWDLVGSFLYCGADEHLVQEGSISPACPLRHQEKLGGENDALIGRARLLRGVLDGMGWENLTETEQDTRDKILTQYDEAVQEIQKAIQPYTMSDWEIGEILVNKVSPRALFILQHSDCSCCTPEDILVSDSLVQILNKRTELEKVYEIHLAASKLVEAGMTHWESQNPMPEEFWLQDDWFNASGALRDSLWVTLFGEDHETYYYARRATGFSIKLVSPEA